MAGGRAPLSAAAGAAVWARVGTAQVEVPGDFAIGVREMGGVGGGCDGHHGSGHGCGGPKGALCLFAGPQGRYYSEASS